MKFVINSCNYFNYSYSRRSLLIYGVSVIALLKRESWVKLIVFFTKGSFSYTLMTAQINLMMLYDLSCYDLSCYPCYPILSV